VSQTNANCSRVCLVEARVPIVSPQGARCFPHFLQAMCRKRRRCL